MSEALALMQAWLARQGISDFAPFESWIATGTVLRLEPGDVLVRAGEQHPWVYLVIEGLVRLYYITPEGKERNKAFYGADQLLGAVSATISGAPASFHIDTLEPSTLVRADFATFYRDAAETPARAALLIQLLADAFTRNEQREAALLTGNAEQRYRWVIAHEPHLLERVSQFHLASYLGIDAVSLSRIKRKVTR